MRTVRVSYYVATSADGFIATSDGGVGWLDAAELAGEDYGYEAFLKSVDGLLMGRKTFDQIMGFGAWPYGEKPCWVWTGRPFDEKPDCVQSTTSAPIDVVTTAQNKGLTHLWLVGGGHLATQFMADGVLDTVINSIVPVVLGRGVPLFGGADLHQALTLSETQTYENGLVQLIYTTKHGVNPHANAEAG